MHRISKRRREFYTQWTARTLERQANASNVLVPLPMAPEFGPDPRCGLELSVEDELESTVEIEFKQEPPESEQDEMEVEVELLDPKNTCLAEEEFDPFGQDPNQQLFPKNRENQQDQIRCQFCLKQFQEGSGRGEFAQSKIEFVLGLRELGTPRTPAACCEGCRRMFEQFYEFKRSCLVSLVRPTELLLCTEATKSTAKSTEPTIQQMGEMIDSKSARFPVSKTKGVQVTEELHGLNRKISDSDSDISVPESEDEKQKRRYCVRCRTWFSTKKIYVQHKPVCVKFLTHPEPPFVCSICPQEFNRQQDLALHIDMHNINDNCISCQELQKRLEKVEDKVQVLTDLNFNLQKEKVKLMAQKNEKAPFDNKVDDWLSPQIVLQVHMECASGSEGDGRFISRLADHLWNKRQLMERSVKGKSCNIHPNSGSNRPATPSKVSFIVEKLIQRVDLEGDLEPRRKFPSRVSRKLNEKMSNTRR